MNMKRINLLMVVMLFAWCQVMAIPAHKGVVKVQQPDGTSVSICLHGDEWVSFTTTEDGYSVVKDNRGYYVYAELKEGQLLPTEQVAHDAVARSAEETAWLAGVQKNLAPAMTEQVSIMRQQVQKRQAQTLAGRRAALYDYNNFKGLIILVQFNDKTFSREDYKDLATDMINKPDYDGYMNSKGKKEVYTGSVRDYFYDNSGGKFSPQFDVVGPYTIDFSQYYAQKTSNASWLVKAAVDAADADVDYSQYDGDGDGSVDLIYLIFAGNGSNYSGNDERLLWPHRSIIYNPSNYQYVWKDGVRLLDYACSVELYGWISNPSSIIIDGIGTICHEFSHVLGLPDFYDTDYEGSGGQSNDPAIWSVMAGGSYENTSRTPVGYSLYERYAVGFTDEPQKITTAGEYTLNPLPACQTGWRIDSPQENEFFLFENRQKSSKWDAYLPGSGMLVHRVDFTNPSVWGMVGGNANKVNANPNHNYYEVVRAGGVGRKGTAYDLFPGTGKVKVLNSTTTPANLKSWAGLETQWGLKDIKMTGDVITFTVEDTWVLQSLVLPATVDLGVGLTRTLELEATPSYAHYTLTWASSDDKVAKVDQTGTVTGIAEGSCTITVRSDNGCEATCAVTVSKLDNVSVDDFKKKDVDTEAMLQLSDAEVLYVYEKTVYLRDTKGCIILSNTDLNVNPGHVVNGTVYVKVSTDNGMTIAEGISGVTTTSDLTVTSGPVVQPVETKLEDLTEAAYGDYVVVKDVTLERDNGVWAVSGSKRVRLYNMFQIPSIAVPKSTDGKTYNITAIFRTNIVDGNVIEEFEMLTSPEEVNTDPEPELLAITMSEATLQMEKDDTRTLTVTPDPIDFTEFTLTWTSTDETVATVSESGLVTAIGEGTCTIKATANNGLEATCEVTVTDNSSGISTVRGADLWADAPLYNLQGQRVNRSVKGLLIRNGKKYVNK